MFKKLFNRNVIIDDLSSNKAFSIGTYIILAFVALVMTVLNIITDKGYLTYATGIFSVCCLFNLALTLIGSVAVKIARLLFAVEVLIMFTFFLVSGNPDGFSAIWICMLPSLGMLLFNRVKGTIMCIAMFFILVFFLWIPFGQQFLMYNYTETFKMRFPVLFLAFHMLAFLLETLRINANNKMRSMQEHYRQLSMQDQLTKLFNRQGMYTTLEKSESFNNAEKITVAMFDIDDFKAVNDKYGHKIGDVVLRRFADILKKNLKSLVCRWGGEEFVVIFPNDDIVFDDFENVRNIIKNSEFNIKDIRFNVTSSIGISSAHNFNVKDIDVLITQADAALYSAKNSGKNKIELYENLYKK